MQCNQCVINRVVPLSRFTCGVAVPPCPAEKRFCASAYGIADVKPIWAALIESELGTDRSLDISGSASIGVWNVHKDLYRLFREHSNYATTKQMVTEDR